MRNDTCTPPTGTIDQDVGRLWIREVAEQSGFSPSTLRFYEQVGLVPPPRRTAAGYRTYDPDVLNRLAFIGRAKALRCTLDEIADLTTAWDGGRCAPVQDRLRRLVADKLDATRAQLRELRALADDLERAAATLDGHRPDGPCDDRCGCTGPSDASGDRTSDRTGDAGADRPTSRPVTFGRTSPAPIACTLDVAGLRQRGDEWRSLLTHATHRTDVGGGVRVGFAASVPLAELAALVAAERQCCSFLAFAIEVDDGGTALRVTAPPEAAVVLDTLFATVGQGRS